MRCAASCAAARRTSPINPRPSSRRRCRPGDPDWDSPSPGTSPSSCARSTHAPDAEEGRRRAHRFVDTAHTCPIPEVARLGRTLNAWRQQVLAYFDTYGVSNGGTEAINLIIENWAVSRILDSSSGC